MIKMYLIPLMLTLIFLAPYYHVKADDEDKKAQRISELLNKSGDRSLDYPEDGWSFRAQWIFYLGNEKDTSVVDTLIFYLLNDEYNNVRAIAAKALGIIGDIRAIQPLFNTLKEESNIGILVNACNSLIMLGQKDNNLIFSTLVDIAKGKNMANWNLEGKCRKSKEKDIKDKLHRNCEERTKIAWRNNAVRSLVKTGNKEVKMILNELTMDEDDHVRKSSINELKELKN